jgi:hypothetical protein
LPIAGWGLAQSAGTRGETLKSERGALTDSGLKRKAGSSRRVKEWSGAVWCCGGRRPFDILPGVIPQNTLVGAGKARGDPALSWRRVLLWTLLFKLVCLSLTFAALRFWPDMDPNHQLGNQPWLQDHPSFPDRHLVTWDAAHYLYLSETGYKRGVPSCAFYPLLPLLMRWTAPLFGGSAIASGMVLCNALSAAAFALFYRVAARRFGARTGFWSLLFLAVYPGSLFYQFIYSEGPFFLLVMLLWLGLEEERYGLAWAGALLLPLSRAVGVFCVLPIAWHLVARKPLWPARRAADSPDDTGEPSAASDFRANRRLYWLLGAPLLGWAGYFALMWFWTGNPWEGFQAQRHWGVHSVWNLINAPKFVWALFTPTDLHAFTGSLVDRCVFLFFLLLLPTVRRLGTDLLVWTYFLGILPAMSGEFTSYTRFASVCFPFFLALGAFRSTDRPAWLLRYWLAALLFLHAMLLWRFVNFRWAG